MTSQTRGGAGNPIFVAKLDRNVGSLGPHLGLVFEGRAVSLGNLPLTLWDLMSMQASAKIELNCGHPVVLGNWCGIVSSHLAA